MIIIGAGYAGLLCGALNPGSVIYEAGPERISDHKAVFRCKTPEIGKLLGIPFKKVTVHKEVWPGGPSIAASHRYSKKVSGLVTGRSIMNTETAIRYIPPANFYEQLKKRCDVRYNYSIDNPEAFDQPIISTIPIHKMAKLLGYTIEKPDYSPIHVAKAIIPACDTYCTIYYPDPAFSAYRASITTNVLTIEGMQEIQPYDIEEIRLSLGLPHPLSNNAITAHTQALGKIVNMDEQIRRNLITKFTIHHNIYSLGRFATWRPKVMMDDVLEDIFVIKRLMQGGKYAALKHEQGGN